VLTYVLFKLIDFQAHRDAFIRYVQDSVAQATWRQGFVYLCIALRSEVV